MSTSTTVYFVVATVDGASLDYWVFDNRAAAEQFAFSGMHNDDRRYAIVAFQLPAPVWQAVR